MDMVIVGEDIRVGAAFDDGKIMPLWFRWRGRYYKVESVNFTWSSNEGNGKLRHYAVTSGANNYELCFNSRDLEWKLVRVSTE